MLNNYMFKTCTRCGVEKSVDEFYRAFKNSEERRKKCKTCINSDNKTYSRINLKKVNGIKRKYVERHKDIVKQSKLKWFDKNPNYKKEWSKRNSKKNNKKLKNRYDNDSLYRLIKNIRGRLYAFLKTKRLTKKNKTFDIVGCSPEFLKEHLEKQFKEGMSWDNHGMFGWHIDHIIPLASSKTEEEIYKLSHYTNLQPLWAKENLQKNDKIII
jgi:hypothetical protein